MPDSRLTPASAALRIRADQYGSIATRAFDVLDRVAKPAQIVVSLHVEMFGCGAADLNSLCHVLAALFGRRVLQPARRRNALEHDLVMRQPNGWERDGFWGESAVKQKGAVAAEQFGEMAHHCPAYRIHDDLQRLLASGPTDFANPIRIGRGNHGHIRKPRGQGLCTARAANRPHDLQATSAGC